MSGHCPEKEARKPNLHFPFQPATPLHLLFKMAVASKHGVAIFGQSEEIATISEFL